MTVIREFRHVSSPLEVRSTWPVVRSFAFGCIFLLFLFGCGGFVVSGWRTWWPNTLETSTPFPVAVLEGRVLWYPSVAMVARGLAATDGVVVPEEENYRAALSIGLRRLRVEALADELGVEISDADVADAFDSTDGAVQDFLLVSGWDEHAYREHVLRPFVLAQRVDVAIRGSEAYQTRAQERLENLRAKVELGIPFVDIATQYSEHVSAVGGGSLGYVLPEEVDPGFAPAFSLSIGETSPVLETENEYWIVKVEDIAKTENNRYFLRGIAVKKDGLTPILDDLMEQADPIILVQ